MSGGTAVVLPAAEQSGFNAWSTATPIVRTVRRLGYGDGIGARKRILQPFLELLVELLLALGISLSALGAVVGFW